jgi:hypothetical protein
MAFSTSLDSERWFVACQLGIIDCTLVCHGVLAFGSALGFLVAPLVGCELGSEEGWA